jgi:hypothetical protein
MFYIGCGKTPCPNFMKWEARPMRRFTVKQLCRTCVLAVPQTTKVGLTKVGNQAKPLTYSEKKVVFLTNYSRCSNIQPPTSYKADNNAAEIYIHSQKCQVTAWWGCCHLKDMGSKILFRINISLPLTLLDWMRPACGLASQVTGPHTNGLLPIRLHGSLDLHINSWSWRGSYCPYHWGSSNYQAATWHFWVHTSTPTVSLSAFYWGWLP